MNQHSSTPPLPSRPIVVGTRGSSLAQWQTQLVVAALQRLAPTLLVETRIIKTTGDKDQVRSLADLGGLGVFTKEIETALLAHEIDLAVHSLKDLPTDLAPGLVIGAILEREDPRDCLISMHAVGLDNLDSGARVGTSSARRAAQLLLLRPDLRILPLRGNVDTRLRKAHSGEYDAVVLAAAGVVRLGRTSEIAEYLPLDKMLPDPGQGALAVEIRSEDPALASLVAQLDHPPTRAAVTAERALLRALGGGCHMPLGTFAETREGKLLLRAVALDADGSRCIRGEISGLPAEAEELGKALGALLLDQGAGQLLKAGPLHGKRIVVTRAHEQANSLAQAIRKLGGEPVEFPTIEFRPLEDFSELDAALNCLSQFDWVVFTSANGVEAVADRMAELKADVRALSQNKIAAIGPATARALQRLGLPVAFIPTRYLGDQVAAGLPALAGERALLLRANLASDSLAHGLKDRGIRVTDVDAYRTVRPAVAPSDWPAADALTLTSSSTARNLAEMLGRDTPAQLTRMQVFCIGPVTAETARSLGLHVDAVAQEHTAEGLVQAIVDYYRA